MSIVHASCLSASDLARLGNNFFSRGRRSYARRPRTPVCSGELTAVIPQTLRDELENGPFGRDYLRSLDRKLEERFPRPR